MWSRWPLVRKSRRKIPVVDIGFLATGAAVLVTFGAARGNWLWRVLAVSWAASLAVSIMGANMAQTVLTMILMDLTIAAVSLTIATFDRDRYDARAIGMTSIAMMPGHWVMSVSHGAPDWTLYMAACNGGFVFQCLIVGGWLNGVGRRIHRIFDRRDTSHIVRGGGR